MKKKWISGILASALVIGGGTMAYVGYAQSNSPSPINPVQTVQRDTSENVQARQANIEEVSQRVNQPESIKKIEENVRPLQQRQIQPVVDVEEAQKIMEEQGVDVEQAQKIMEEQGINIDEMYDAMTEGNFDKMIEFMNNQNVDFNQMQEYMNQVNPNRSPQGNFQGMRNFR